MSEEERHSILIVDDQSSNIEALKQILRSEYTVYTASSGKNAIELAEKLLPDLILLDIVMPVMDGYTVIAELKNSNTTKHIPVIFLTGLNSDDEEEKGLHLGAADYITKPFSLATVRLRVRNQIQMLIQLRTIERLSIVDQLTDMPNRRGFEKQLNSEWARAIRDKTIMSILFVDVDKFKNYNDSFGHRQGDIALQTLARVFKDTLKRPGDYSARWGGEEFIALLPNTDVNGSLEVAEHLRKNVEDVQVPCTEENALKITISVGVNTMIEGKSNSIEEFISNADAALYNAKENGRNRVSHFRQI
ncbi:MAG: diguanylate cyclase [Treponema sp.]|nr:diguanylate cyclase [Treponema sp.]